MKPACLHVSFIPILSRFWCNYECKIKKKKNFEETKIKIKIDQSKQSVINYI